MSEVSGLTTIALLKANYDEGMDYLEMFMPFVLYIICEQSKDLVEVETVQESVKNVFDINIPQKTIKTLLNKAKRKGAVLREGGKYLKSNDYNFDQNLLQKRKNIERQLNAIGLSLLEFLKKENILIDSVEEALAILFKFLSNQELELLLDIEYENKPIDSSVLKTRQMRGVAKFVKEKCLKDPQLAEYLNNILIGFVLQNALLLKNIATPSQVFENLRIYLDSGFILGLLGWKGAARELANKDTLELLKSTNAFVAVFEQTVAEIKRILYAFEVKLGTQHGRENLWQSDVTRYVLSEKLTPSDIKQEISLLERKLEFDYGIAIHETPDRVTQYTQDEKSLAKKLGAKDINKPSKRIIHDIDCIAGILTLRKNDKPTTLDNTNAIFMSGSSSVVYSVREWHEEKIGKHLPPIIHHLTLTNIAWLKRPEVGAKIKVNELVALCTAALRPKKETWDKFLKHLKKLEDKGDLTTEESVAIVASKMIEKELITYEDDENEIDSNSIYEIVSKVKDDYRKEAIKVQGQLENDLLQKNNTLKNVDNNISYISKIVANIFFWFSVSVIVLGSIFLFPNIFDQFNIGVVGYVLPAIIIILTAYSLIFDFRLWEIKNKVENFIKEKLLAWFTN